MNCTIQGGETHCPQMNFQDLRNNQEGARLDFVFSTHEVCKTPTPFS